LFLDGHVAYLQVEPDDPAFKEQEIKMWDVTK